MKRLLSLVASVTLVTVLFSGCVAAGPVLSLAGGAGMAAMNISKKDECSAIYADKSLSDRELKAKLYAKGC